ncbi:hypothetical protein GCM10023091_24320 [Ravibacter arvi]|uniref:Uncharacterized protein n=2 Tax=Ravibacter arvi TaxID=2051041 RepID=A0ABP8M0J7_9BACT
MFLGCEKDQLESPKASVEGDKLTNKKNREARMGPGFSWELETTNHNVPAEYNDTGTSRQYYLKGSQSYTRTITLKVTKTSATTPDSLKFHVYEPLHSCIILSSVSASMGTATYKTWGEHHSGFYYEYKGYEWKIPVSTMNSSPIGTTATFVFTARSPHGISGSCIEGSVTAKMNFPANIPSSYNFWDGDYMPFLINPSI